MAYEYKVVGAPEKGKRARGAKTRSDKVAVAFEEILNAEAVDGWEYMRTDLMPVEEKPSFFARREEIHRAVMIFRRPVAEARGSERKRTRDDLFMMSEHRSERPRQRRPEPEIRLAHSADREDEPR